MYLQQEAARHSHTIYAVFGIHQALPTQQAAPLLLLLQLVAVCKMSLYADHNMCSSSKYTPVSSSSNSGKNNVQLQQSPFFLCTHSIHTAAIIAAKLYFCRRLYADYLLTVKCYTNKPMIRVYTKSKNHLYNILECLRFISI